MFARRRIFFAGAAIVAILLLLRGYEQDAVWVIPARRLRARGGARRPVVELLMGEDALIPPELLHQRQFVVCCTLAPLLATGFFVLLLYLPQYMQKLLSYSPLKAGLGLLPMMVVFGAVSFVAGTLYNRLGARLSISTGVGAMTIGLFVLTFVNVVTGYGLLALSMALFGIGRGLF